MSFTTGYLGLKREYSGKYSASNTLSILGGGCLWDSYEPKLSKCHLIIVFCSSLAIKGHHVAFKGHQRPICVYIFLLSHNYLLSSATLQPIFGLSYIYLSIIFTSQMFNVGLARLRLRTLGCHLRIERQKSKNF